MRPDDRDALPAEVTLAGAGHPGSGGTDASSESSGLVTATEHLLSTDPGGCWVVDDDRRIRAAAIAIRRDLVWILARFVAADGTPPGVLRALLAAAADYGSGCLRGWTCGPTTAATISMLRGAAFDIQSTLHLTGTVDRSTLPVVDGVRPGTDGDVDFADSVDRQVRGAARGPDHALLLAHCALLTCDVLTGRGYAYVRDGRIEALSATNRSVAQRLLWSALATAPVGQRADVPFITSAQGWALDVALAAGLRAGPGGVLAVRHTRPPQFHLPSPTFG